MSGQVQVTDENPPPTFQRYRRRCSVTRYSLDQMSPPEIVPKVEPNVITPQESDSAMQEVNAEPVPHRRYQRRSSVTRYSYQQDPASYRPQTKSLSPNPLKRRGSMTIHTVEQVSNNETGNQMNEEVVVTPPENAGQEGAPRARFRRRCSVTKFSLDNTAPGEEREVAVKFTVEEPMDTVEALEHRQMLANDTIESNGAGDLLVGWNQAAADFLENERVTMAEYGIETRNNIDSDITMKMKEPQAIDIKQDTHIMQSKALSNKEISTEETYGTYLYRILRKSFAPTSLVSNLQHNSCNETAVNGNNVN